MQDDHIGLMSSATNPNAPFQKKRDALFEARLNDAQHNSVVLAGLLEGLEMLEFEKPGSNAVTCLLPIVVQKGHELAVAMDTVSLSAPGDDILDLFRQWLAVYHIPSSEDEMFEEECVEKMRRIEEEMMKLPSVTAADFAAKLIVTSSFGGLLCDWKSAAIWDDARRLVGCKVDDSKPRFEGASEAAS